MCVLCGAGPHAQGVRMRYPVSRAVLGPHSWGRPSPATVHASPRGFLRLIGTPYARARVEKIGALALKPACACPVRSVCLMCKNSGRHAPTDPCRMSWGGGGHSLDPFNSYLHAEFQAGGGHGIITRVCDLCFLGAHERTWARTRTRACTARKCINRCTFYSHVHLNMFFHDFRPGGRRLPRRRGGD